MSYNFSYSVKPLSVFQNDEDKELGIVRLGMMKNRFGANYGTQAMRVDYNTLTLSEDETIQDNGDTELGDISNALGMLSN